MPPKYILIAWLVPILGGGLSILMFAATGHVQPCNAALPHEDPAIMLLGVICLIVELAILVPVLVYAAYCAIRDWN